jgi:hypothetical protein
MMFEKFKRFVVNAICPFILGVIAGQAWRIIQVG